VEGRGGSQFMDSLAARCGIGVEVWCDAVVSMIVRVVVGAMVLGWRRGGCLLETAWCGVGVEEGKRRI